MEIIHLKPDGDKNIFREIAQLHIQSIHHSLLPLMGINFLSCLYKSLSKAPQTGVWFALEKNKVVGFLAGSGDAKNSFLSVILKDTFPLALFAGKAFLSVNVLKKIPSIFTYLFNARSPKSVKDEKGVIKAELLAIAVDVGARGRGIGRLLIESFEKQLRVWKMTGYYRVTTSLAEKESNSFYCAIGFEKAGTLPHHQLTLQRYIKKISQ